MRARYLLAVGAALLADLVCTARAEDEGVQKQHLNAWARKFEHDYCPKSCDFREKELAAAQKAQADRGKLPSDYGPALAAQVGRAERELAECRQQAAAQRAILVRELNAIDCEHLLTLAERPVQCGTDVRDREGACRARLAEARRREEQARAEQQRARDAAHAALLQDEHLMLVTISAAICRYDAARTAVQGEASEQKSSTATARESAASDEGAERRLKVINSLGSRTMALLQRWNASPLACSNELVSHVTECLMLTEFKRLGDDFTGVQPAARCQDELILRANEIGTLLPAIDHAAGQP